MPSRRLALASILIALPIAARAAAPPVPPAAEFLHQVVAAGSFIRQAGLMTEEHTNTVDVRVYADGAIADYARAIGNVKAAGGAEGFRTIDNSLSADQEQMLADLQAADPKAFDKALTKAEVKVQEQTLATIQAYAKRGDDALIRQAATNAAAILQPSLDQARLLNSRTH